MRAGAMLAVPALGALLGGCSTSFVRRNVQKRVQSRLASWLGPAEQYRVRIQETRDAVLVLGRAKRVEIEGTRIMARGQFLIDSLRLTLTDLRYEAGEADFLSVRRSDLEIEFTEAALNDYLAVHLARYKPEIRFGADAVRVRLTYPFLGTPTTLRATGRLVIREGRQLLFTADEAEVPFVLPGDAERQFVESRINPLLDLKGIDFPARLETVQVMDGRLRAHGTAALRREL
jgi:hypothetical protein